MTQTLLAPEPLEAGMASAWMLGPDVTYLNHGSFGARPRAVYEHQSSLLDEFERQPVQSIVADTEAVNSILRSLDLQPGDELLIPDHAYNAVHQTLRYVARRTGAVVKVVHIPLPIHDEESMVQPILDAFTSRTRLLLIDHITSPTALVFPIAGLVRAARDRGVDVLVDGAHGPGMMQLDLDALGATWYVGNLHKWVCAPVGAAFIATDPSR
ncbi:MAG: aminotransferase class V-fold PLP-dependent enzyme, partial [Planctomycetota bacterium]|nr:aminotransferase class V-fold PLP-dependent enzyme [Planctomycetota bacterium]